MTNRLMTRAEIDGATIWHSPEHRKWWMEPRDPVSAAEIVLQYPDAIDVTNAYDVLPLHFIEQLMSDAGR